MHVVVMIVAMYATLNFVFFLIDAMWWIRDIQFFDNRPSTAYFLVNAFFLALPGMWGYDGADNSSTWLMRRVQRHADSRCTNAADIIAEREHLETLERGPGGSNTQQAIFASRERLKRLRQLDAERADTMFMDTLEPDEINRRQTLSTALRAEAEVLDEMTGAEVDQLPAQPAARWRRLVQAWRS